VLLVWNRIIFSNGNSIVLERQPGADASGYSGLEDKGRAPRAMTAAIRSSSCPEGVGTVILEKYA
jgi:type IV secretion system protein VirB10